MSHDDASRAETSCVQGHEKVAMPVGPTAGARIPSGRVTLSGDLSLPAEPQGIMLFAHGSGSSRFSSRNRSVARTLDEHDFGALEEGAWLTATWSRRHLQPR